jgi:hypothetical protein
VLQHAESDAAQRLSERLANVTDQIATTSISAEEQFRSSLALINRYSELTGCDLDFFCPPFFCHTSIAGRGQRSLQDK